MIVFHVNTLTYRCECNSGYTGTNCELKINLCRNVTCANNGICKMIDMNWKCFCLSDTLYYGEYCQHRTNALKVKIALTKSFASVAISAITITCSFVILMDVLKYVFKIDPVKTERHRRKRKRRRNHPNAPPQIVRYQYIA